MYVTHENIKTGLIQLNTLKHNVEFIENLHLKHLNVTKSKLKTLFTQACINPISAAILDGGHFEDFRRPKFLYTDLFHRLLSYIFQKKPSNFKAKIV